MMALEQVKRRRKRRPVREGPPVVIGYLRVSTDEQADSGYGLGAQQAAIEREAEHRGWQVRWITDAGQSGKSLDRPGLSEALRLLADGEADVLAVSKLDRLSRSVHDFSGLVALAEDQGWSLRVLDLGLDMTTPQGELMANVLASFATFERRTIGERTKAALARAKARGVAIGRRPSIPEDVRGRILDLRATGASYPSIAATLNDEGVPTSRGGSQWYPSTVRAVVQANERADPEV